MLETHLEMEDGTTETIIEEEEQDV